MSKILAHLFLSVADFNSVWRLDPSQDNISNRTLVLWTHQQNYVMFDFSSRDWIVWWRICVKPINYYVLQTIGVYIIKWRWQIWDYRKSTFVILHVVLRIRICILFHISWWYWRNFLSCKGDFFSFLSHPTYWTHKVKVLCSEACPSVTA